MIRLTISIACLLAVITSCNLVGNSDNSITISHYAGGPGITVIYIIDRSGIRVDANCDLENCKIKTVYERTFSEAESDSVIQVLNSLRLDTLNTSYKMQGFYSDGFITEIKFSDGIFSTHKTTFYNIYTPTADSLNYFIDFLVKKREYKLASWGETE